MEPLQSLLALPFPTVASLATGYLGYRLAYVGRGQTHKPLDVLLVVSRSWWKFEGGVISG